MTSTTVEGDVVTGERTIHGVDPKRGLPCEMNKLHRRQGRPMAEAEWRVFWNLKVGWCACIHTRRTTLVCTGCKEVLLNSAGLMCIKCGNMVALGRAIERIEAL